ncbi:MAG: DUF4332 domain-containing protein [Thermoanaerobaculia bacterium]
MRPRGMGLGAGRWRWWGAAGAALFAGGLFVLARDVEGWNAIWYLPAWYGYLLVLDALIFRLQGSSPLSARPREVAGWMLWSIPFWFLFEAYNLRLQNWYYVFALRSIVTAAVLSATAFATVLPACFFHAEAVRALGIARGRRCRPIGVTPRVESVLLLLGVLSILAPLLWPRVAFPLVWGATFCLPELLNRRAGAPSLLADLEAGRCDRLMHLLAGGLWAGVAWESLNFFARCKWIYTVPGFEDWKVFEMPLAGFLGFPVLALSAFNFSSLVSRLSSREALRSPAGRARLAIAVALAAALVVASYREMLSQTVRSRRPVLTELPGLDFGAESRLRAHGIPTPERLERARRRHRLDDLSRRTGIPASLLERAGRHATLALHKGMGIPAARLLESVGIPTVAELARARPEALHARLRSAAGKARMRPPRLAEVKVWVRAARLTGKPRR